MCILGRKLFPFHLGQSMRKIQMKTRSQNAPAGDEQAIYQIKLKGMLDEQWSHWFDGLTITSHYAGCTLLTGMIRDQAALHDLLNKIRDMGIPLISVEIIDSTSNDC